MRLAIRSFLSREYILDALEFGEGQSVRKWLRVEYIVGQVLMCISSAGVVINIGIMVYSEVTAERIAYAAVFALLTLGILIRSNSLSRAFIRYSDDISITTDVLEPFILYLRPFDYDRRLARPQPLPFPLNFLRSIFWFGYTEEQLFVYALRSISPVVAVGRPRQQVPHAGAQRVRLGENWQTEVSALMRRARLVVILIGPGEAIMWELTEAMYVLEPERLILIVPMDASEYSAFRSTFRKYASLRNLETGRTRPLPDLPVYGDATPGLRSRIQGIIHFCSSKWQPIFTRPQRYSRLYNSLYVAVRQSLSCPTRLTEDAPNEITQSTSETLRTDKGEYREPLVVVSTWSHRISSAFGYYSGVILSSTLGASLFGELPVGFDGWLKLIASAWFVGLIAMKLVFSRLRKFRHVRLVVRDEGIVIPNFGHGVQERWDNPDDDRIDKVVLYWYQIESITLHGSGGLSEQSFLDVDFRVGATSDLRKAKAYLTGADMALEELRDAILRRSPDTRLALLDTNERVDGQQ